MVEDSDIKKAFVQSMQEPPKAQMTTKELNLTYRLKLTAEACCPKCGYESLVKPKLEVLNGWSYDPMKTAKKKTEKAPRLVKEGDIEL